ncbi:MAG: T9SS type A sorting domain-containing protein [Bacteroidia bacterium]
MRVFYIVLFSLLNFPLSAQNYVPFALDSAAWSVDFITPGPFSQEFHVPRLYFMNGDSVINGLNYHKTYQYGDSIPFNSGGLLTSLIREQNKIIYCRYFNWNNFSSEFELYNFNLTIGDTFSFPNIIDSVKMVLISVDSEYTTTGYRKAFNFNIVYNPSAAFYMNPRWVEGIGDIVNGIVYLEVPILDWWCQALCYSESYFLVWNWNQGNCWITGMDETTHSEKIKLLNNPSLEKIQILFPDNLFIEKEITVHEISGKIVGQYKFYDQEFTLFKHSLGRGMYFLDIKSGDDFLKTYKIIFL